MSSFARALLARCAISAQAPFVLQEEKIVSWADLAEIVPRGATLLADLGIRPGDRVLLACGNNPTFLYLWFMLRHLGAVCVPLHGQATAEHTRAVVADAEIGFAVGDRSGIERLAGSGIERARMLGFDAADQLEQAVAGLARRDLHDAPPDAESSVLYTSGTTGAPKGVVLRDASFLAGGAQLARVIGIGADDRILIGLPLFHTNPQVYAVMAAVATGCSLALLERFDAARFLDDAARYRATGFTYVGTVLAMLVAALPESLPAHRLRFCTGGGISEPIWETIEDRLGIAVHELYGMTETGGWVTANGIGPRRRGSCGRARPDIELAVLDADDLPVPAGTTGQICVRPRAPNVIFSHYHGRPAMTLEKFRNLWFHTGDLGALSDDGYLTFLGRSDDTIRRAGENVRPADVETALAAHPEIAEVAVVGVFDEIMGQEVRAVVVAGERFDPRSLPEFLAGRLPRFAWPRYIAIRTALPKTQTQKVRLGELRQRADDDIDLRGNRT